MHRLFPSQLDNEVIYLVVRQHPFILFVRLLIWAFFASGLVIFQRFGPQNIPGLFEGVLGKYTSLAEQIYLLILLLGLFLILIIYYLTIQIITDIRVVDVDQSGLFSHTVSELHIDKIEDVTSKTTGIFGTIFNYGDVFIQTAGTIERFEFDNVPNPAAIEKLILDLYEQNSNFAKEGREGDNH
jgi:uncharacterized membrane protein YdbT with pleckstrin-like domain